MSVSNCVFCKADLSGNRAKEHVIPAWLQEHLGVQDTPISPSHQSITTDIHGNPSGTEIRSVRKHTLSGLLAGHICKTCNHNWMAGLEGAVKPILIPLIAGERDIRKDSHTEEERLLIARWAAKTAYVLNDSANYPAVIPGLHFNLLCENSGALPENVVVIYGYNPHWQDFNWIQQSLWSAQLDSVSEEEFQEAAARSYKTTFQFGHMLLTVAHWHDARMLYSLEMGTHVPVWPTKGQVLWRQLVASGPVLKSAQEEFLFFHAGLEVGEASNVGERAGGRQQVKIIRYDETRK